MQQTFHNINKNISKHIFGICTFFPENIFIHTTIRNIITIKNT